MSRKMKQNEESQVRKYQMHPCFYLAPLPPSSTIIIYKCSVCDSKNTSPFLFALILRCHHSIKHIIYSKNLAQEIKFRVLLSYREYVGVFVHASKMKFYPYNILYSGIIKCL